MLCVARRWLVAAALLHACTAAAQERVPPTGEVPTPIPALANTPVLEDRNGSLLAGDIWLNPADAPSAGWFAALEIGFIRPELRNGLREIVPVAGLPNQPVDLQPASLDWTGAPRFEVGYRCAQGFGEFQAAYRFLNTDGAETLPGGSALTSRLSFHVIDLDYGSHEFSLGEQWDMKWRIGARLVTNYFDARSRSAVLEQRASSQYVGAGPHVGLELQRRLGWSSFSVVSRTEASMQVGRMHQAFETTVLAGANPLVGGAVDDRGSQYVPILRQQVGLGWSPPAWQRAFRFLTGYEFEEWWWIGRFPGPVGSDVLSTNQSNINLILNGIFIRGEWQY